MYKVSQRPNKIATIQLRRRIVGQYDTEIDKGRDTQRQLQGAQTETLQDVTNDSMIGAVGCSD
jgi:hypothetical protein